MGWNDTASDFPRQNCIHQLFEAQAERTPDAPAVVFKDRELTYSELNKRANGLAHRLKALGIGSESLVGICAERSPEMLVGTLAILKAGAAYVPLDATHPDARLSAIVSDAEPRALLTQRHLVSRLPNLPRPVILLDSEFVTQGEQDNLAIEQTLDTLAYVIYTSGSTGKPKGVLISHGSLVNHSTAMARLYDLRPSDRVLQFASFSFDVAAEEILPTWLSGAAVVLWPIASGVAPIRSFLEFVEDQKITILNLPASYWHEWVLELGQVQFPPTLRLVVVGSDKVLSERFSIWQKHVGARVRLCNAYGPTEATITATVYEPSATTQPTTDCLPIGRPIANTRVYVLDEHLNRLPVGVAGELHIGGLGLARGYLNLPELTAEKFIPDPFSERPGDRLYKTGDLVRHLPDGNLEFLGRTDDQVKIRGYRIESGEIEAALHQHPAVHSAVVIAREADPGEKKLVAYFVAKNSARLSPDELRSFLMARLPEYMVPAAFVPLKQMPLTPGGKVDRRQLPPIRTRAELESEFLPPRNEIESMLAEIWEGMLGVKPVGIRDNFFELGGESLQLIRLATQIEKRLGVNLTLTAVFHARTIEGLARLVESGKKCLRPYSLVHPYRTEGDRPPLFSYGGSEEMGRCLGPGQPIYWLQEVGIDGRKWPDSIEEMAAEYLEEMRLVQHHGPYFLAGYSFGGLVMFELAHQLLNQGERVALLVLIDPSQPNDEEARKAFTSPGPLRGLCAGFLYHCRNLARLRFREKLDYIAVRLGWRIRRLVCEACFLLGNRLPAFVRPFYFFELVDKSIERYVPPVYPRAFILFRRADRGTTAQWRRLAVGELEIHEIPSSVGHGQILKEPYVHILAGRLKTYLRDAQAAILVSSR